MRKWLSRYLNTRYFELSDGVRVREGADYRPGNWETRRIRTVTDQRPWLDQASTERGVFRGSDFRIWWWILTPDPQRTKDSHYATGGFIAAKFLHELVELKERGHAPAILQKFGVTFGATRVVLIIEPGVTSPDVHGRPEPIAASVDLQRVHLKRNGQPLDWDRYAAEFRAAMPVAIRELVEDEAYGGDDEGRRRRYRASMDKLRELFSLPRYRPARGGEEQVDPAVTGPGGAGLEVRGTPSAQPGPARQPRAAHPPARPATFTRCTGRSAGSRHGRPTSSRTWTSAGSPTWTTRCRIAAASSRTAQRATSPRPTRC